jgi:hypothetical protein
VVGRSRYGGSKYVEIVVVLVVVSVVWLTAPGRARRRVPSGVGGEGRWKAVGEELLSGVTVGTVGTVGNLSNLGKAPSSVVFPDL